eukprot:378262_1
MSLQLEWEDVNANELDGFDFDEWVKREDEDNLQIVSATKATSNPDKPQNASESMDLLSSKEHITESPPTNHSSDSKVSNQTMQLQCPICQETCDTIKALKVHCSSCSADTDSNPNIKQNLHIKEKQQNQWKNILNMNKRVRDDAKRNDISYEIPYKKRKVSTMTRKKGKTTPKRQIQTTLHDIGDAKYLDNTSPNKSDKKRNKNMVKKVTPRFDIDLFPSEKDCDETDEKSDEIHIKQVLKDKNINHKSMRKSFLKLNQINGKENKNMKEIIIVSDTDINEMDAIEDSPLSPVIHALEDTQGMTEHILLTQAVNSSKKKRKKSNEFNKKEIKFIPPWDLK